MHSVLAKRLIIQFGRKWSRNGKLDFNVKFWQKFYPLLLKLLSNIITKWDIFSNFCGLSMYSKYLDHLKYRKLDQNTINLLNHLLLASYRMNEDNSLINYDRKNAIIFCKVKYWALNKQLHYHGWRSFLMMILRVMYNCLWLCVYIIQYYTVAGYGVHRYHIVKSWRPREEMAFFAHHS